MSSPLRIATFNAQNLFDRAAIFDIKDGVENQKLLIGFVSVSPTF